MTAVRLENITKQFGATVALRNVNLQIATGELFFLLGPSGCGKSTLLRLIAGLHEPTAGRILFDDRDVTSLGTEKRNAVMCFQSYALWPHMTVRENVRFGLNVRGLPREQQNRRVEEVLELVRMREFAERKPNALSGGQQQRVALARALAVHPDCLLLDEPLSNLDAQLRLEMRGEIRRICKSAGFTTIYVTHDQKEALSVADRIAVMEDGRIVQVGTPAELYHKPASPFVAAFVGATNLIPGELVEIKNGLATVKTAIGPLTVAAPADPQLGRRVTVSIRPEHMRAASPGTPGMNRIIGTIKETTFVGETSEHILDAAGLQLRVTRMPPEFAGDGEMTVEFLPEEATLFAVESPASKPAREIPAEASIP
ncbi:MAG TPA: ABC transporter ATP-binding protein [Tepidisphaeraceae bacterium]|nr:ABC transporter ATP-binding protein [Tepidisphaeraceae bacterium]